MAMTAKEARRDGLLAAGVVLAFWWWSNRRSQPAIKDYTPGPQLPTGPRRPPERTGEKKPTNSPMCSSDRFSEEERHLMQDRARSLTDSAAPWETIEEARDLAFDIEMKVISELCPQFDLPPSRIHLESYLEANDQFATIWRLVDDYVWPRITGQD